MIKKNKFQNKFTSSQFVKYVDKNEIKGIVGSLGNTISKKYEGQELVVIGVLKGSTTFLADLVREIHDVKLYIDFVQLGSIGRSKESNGTIKMIKDITVDLLNKNVLIVEEVIDTGRALHFLKDRLSLANPKSLEVVTLFDKPYKRAVPINADLIGKKIDDHFIVGYGLDLEEYGRNFEDVYFLKYPN